MSISIKSAKPVAPFESFELSHFGLHVNSTLSPGENQVAVWTISLLCVLDISKDESLPKLINVELTETYDCCGLIPVKGIIISPKENRDGEETLWSIILEISMEKMTYVRMMDIFVNIETRRPRKKKARTIAQALVDS